jgi:formylglycine-generating enzyme required for sulfatase activity
MMTVTHDSGVSPVLDDRPTLHDSLDFVSYCDTLVDILRNPATRTPLTVGLFGAWGSGKTSLMRMVKNEIDQTAITTCRTAWFNAWKYDREDALWRAFVLRVLDALRPLDTDGTPFAKEELGETQKTLVEELDHLEESVYRSVEWEEVGRWTLDWAKALRGTAEGAAEIALSFVPGAKPLVDLLTKTSKSVTGKDHEAIAEAFRREVKLRRLEQLRSLEQFEREFQTLLDRHIVAHEGRLIVFVDDLDRCLPEKAIQVLEAIKLFLDVPGCVFVLGLDEEAIIEAVHTRYEGKVKARQYLEKIIQLPFLLPPIEAARMRGFVDSLVPYLPDHRCSQVFAEGLFPNPRQVKRTINIFLLLWKLSQQKLPEAVRPVRLAKVVAIQHSSPSFYALAREVPGVLRDLEQYFRVEAKRLGEQGALESAAMEQGAPDLPPPQLQPFVGDAGLRRLLTLHPDNEPDANFSDLTPEAIRPYIYLTHRVTPPSHVVETPKGAAEPQTVIIPPGEFIMGGDDSYAHSDERPRHKLVLPEYAVGRYPVTNFEYRAFIRDTGYNPPSYWENGDYPEELGDYPVVYVRWHDALAYCAWLSQKTGKSYRLPTEAEWEKAARGIDERLWPWGQDWGAAKCNSKESGLGRSTPVGQYSPQGDSPYRVADMAGNVWEWCSSLYAPYPYKLDDGREDLKPDGDRVLRGGSFSSDPRLVRCSCRYGHLPNSRGGTIGFRVAVASSGSP